MSQPHLPPAPRTAAPAARADRPWRHPLGAPARSLAALAISLALVLAAVVLPATASSAANRTTPGDFTGYGFDQCVTPTQSDMDAWLRSSPFWAVGIYISGDSRACRTQPNLTPAWVANQLRKGWRLLPITLGPQASCSTRFPRYGDDETIVASSGRNYAQARAQGRAEATTAVAAARRLGIVPTSTLWYDLEAFDIGNRRCRESAIKFLHAWTRALHDLDYVAGVYSSAASGIRMLDDVRVDASRSVTLPDRIWVADWNGRADVHSTYIRSDGWMPRDRMHQYRGGHHETHGGVTINIDSNYLDLGRGSEPRRDRVHCGGVDVDFSRYSGIGPSATGARVEAAECLLKEKGYFDGRPDGTYGTRTVAAVRAFRTDHGLPSRQSVTKRVWMALLSKGIKPLLKHGAASDAVRRLQRSLNAHAGAGLAVTGTFEGRTADAVKDYQAATGLTRTGVVTKAVWRKIKAGTL